MSRWPSGNTSPVGVITNNKEGRGRLQGAFYTTPVNKSRNRHKCYIGSECQECRPDSNHIDAS